MVRNASRPSPAGIVRVKLPGRLVFDGTDLAVGDWIGLDGSVVRSALPRRSALTRNAAGRATRRPHAKGRHAVERITAMATNAKSLTPDSTAWQVRWAIPECAVLIVSVVLLVLAIIFR